MAAKKNKLQNSKTNATNRKKIWEQLPTDVWLKVANEFRKSHQFTTVGPNKIKGKCIFPGHADTNPSFYIDTDSKYASCYGCNKHINDPIEIMQYMLGSDKIGTINYLRDKLSITVLNKKAEEELEALRLDQFMKQELYTITHNFLCDAVAYPTNENQKYAQPIINWLEQARHINKTILHQLPIGILPPVTNIAIAARQRYSIKLRAYQNNQSGLEEPVDISPLIQSYLTDYANNTDLIGSIIFPLHSSISEISRFKIRTLINGTSKNFKITDNKYYDTIGLFGLGWEPYLPFLVGKHKTNELFLTEGEFDALALMIDSIIKNTRPRIPIVASGGSSSAKDIEPILKSSGIDQLYLIPDSPSKQGDIIGAEWCKNIRSLHVKIFDAWSKLPGTKDSNGVDTGHDLDSAIASYGADHVVSIIGETQTSNYLNPSRWVFERAITAIDESANDSLRAKIEIAATYGRSVRNRIDRQEYIELIAKHYDINEPQLARELSSREDTEPGFIQLCADAVVRKFFIVGHQLKGSKRVLALVSRTQKSTHEIILDSEESIATEFAPLCGTLMSFVERYVGFPSFLENPRETDANIYKATDLKLRMYMKEALLSLAEGAPDMNGKRYRQGYHVLHKNTENQVEYIVEGSNVIRIERDINNFTNPKYNMLEGPSDAENNVVFPMTKEEDDSSFNWYSGGISLDALEDPEVKNMSLKELYNDLCDFYNTGFRYEYQDVDSKLMAALIMVLPISNIFKRPPCIFITGDSKSGKSTFASTLSGAKNKNIRLLFASQVADTITLGGVTRMADRNTLALVLDEFEASDTPAKEKHISAIMEVFRSLVNGIATRVISKPHGNGYFTQIFEQPMIYIAITSPTKTQDANRMINIKLKNVTGHKTAIETLIPQKFSKTKLNSIRKRLNLGMFQYATALASLQDKIEEELFELQKKLPTYMDTRLASAFIAPLAIMKLALDGEEKDKKWKQYITGYIEAHSSEIETTTQTTESEALIASIFRNPFIKQEDGKEVSIAYLLANSEIRMDINKPSTGCYYDASSRLLLILLDVAITKLLSIENRKYGRTAHQLKSAIDRHPNALTYDEIETSGILLRTGSTLGAGIRAKDVCVLHVDNWIYVNKHKPTKTDTQEKHVEENPDIYTSIETTETTDDNVEEISLIDDNVDDDAPPLV